ncbi:MAG: saccharopine dehydrogenase NADP-binding domain-containing protein [Solirubrobacterales bacterium]|nr:saccharopine dehydrogenase NADP-binding domain-containing protein [Solirubrobacterales bacterium]
MPDDRQFDLVLFGATGFTGGLTADYLAEHVPAGTRWALAGRNREKLEKVRERLAAITPASSSLELLEADVTDAASIRTVAEATRVIATTVGPYILHGEPLVAACAAAGTDYLDLTGEPEFVDLMWLRHHASAVKSGARLVHCCGFDSIPHDLGAQFTVELLPSDGPISVKGFVRAGGSFSAGTFHSAVTAFGRAREYAKVQKQRKQQETLPEGRRARAVAGRPYVEPELDKWAIPMPTIDPAIVVRSARALPEYGPDFTYGHYTAVKRIALAAGGAAGVGALFAAAQVPPVRKLILGRMTSGDGPSDEAREKGWFTVTFVGEGDDKRVVTTVHGDRDPGYTETAKMLAEATLCLALDELPETAGQVTPAQAMGVKLRERLDQNGITFTVVS